MGRDMVWSGRATKSLEGRQQYAMMDEIGRADPLLLRMMIAALHERSKARHTEEDQ